MQHVVHKAHTCWVAEGLIRGHLVAAGNHRHGTAGHNLGRGFFCAVCSLLGSYCFLTTQGR